MLTPQRLELRLDARNPLRPRPALALVPPPATPIVFLVDGDVSVRHSLEPLVDPAGWKVEAFASANEFLARPRASGPSCLVLDAANGLDMQQRLADRPEMPIIFVSGSGDVRTAVDAMKAGAIEFFIKPFADELLLGAMHYAVLAHQAELELLRQRYASLSGRERDVMALIVCGLLNKQAGAELGISEITVKAHRGQMMRKMGARSLPDLVKMAAKLFPA
jgi:FixJ family two-component response regulator